MRAWLGVTAGATLAILTLMIAFTAAGAPAGDSVAAQLADLRDDSGLYRWGFFFASLVPAAMVPFMAGVAALSWGRRGVPRESPTPFGGVREGTSTSLAVGWDAARTGVVAGLVLVAAYAPLSAAAYASQYTVFEWLLRRDLAAAALWYFNNGDGGALTFDLLAYAIWGTGAMLIAWPLRRADGALAILAWSLLASGATSVIAFALHALESDVAGAVSTASGALIVPAVVAALVYALRRPTTG